MCAVAQGGGGDTGIWRNVSLVAMEDFVLDVEMAMQDVVSVEDVEFDEDMESWVELVFWYSTYWKLQHNEEK